MKNSTEKKFWDRVIQQGDCLIWTGSIDKRTGRGRFRFDGIDVTAQMFAYLLVHGEIPVGIRYTCGNPACVKVDHLVSGVRQANPGFEDLICQIDGCNNKPESRGTGKKPRRICSLCRRKGLLSTLPDQRYKVTLEVEKNIKKMHLQGMIQKDIGKVVGINQTSVAKVLARLGLSVGKGRRADRPIPETPDGMKWCNKCEEIKPVDGFWAHNSAKDGLCCSCKECMSKQHKENRAAMRHRARTAYKLSLEEYDTIMAAIPLCPICGETTSDLDHDSETGQIRSPLCGKCNRGLGQFGHDPDRLRKAADYMEIYL